MIKATGVVDGRPTVMLGLSRRNLERFLEQMNDTYIRIPREKLGITFDLLIFSGETELEMAEQLKALGAIDERTVIHKS